MQKQALTNMLIELGLSEKEAKVYLASLSLGPTTVLKISNAAEINRTTGYPVIKALRSKGLMISEWRGLKELFVAERPEKLESILELKRKKFQSLLPEFSALYNLEGDEGSIKYYEGLAGVKSVYEALLKEVRVHEDYLVVSDEEQWLQLDEIYFSEFLKRRAKLNIAIRMLLQDSKIAREHKKFEKNFNQTVKIFSENVKLQVNLVITPQQIVIHQLIPPIGAMVIKNKSAIRLMQQCFEVMWQSIPNE